MSVKIPIEHTGALTRLGYSSRLPPRARHQALLRAVESYGLNDVIRKLNAIAVLNMHRPVGEIFRADQRWLSSLPRGGMIWLYGPK